LQAIFDVIAFAQQVRCYDRVWDCCCDHGYLGMSIVNAALCEKLIFVDQVPHIAQQLERQLLEQPLLYPAERYEVLTSDASDLDFNSEQRHLVILAGVSGKTVVDIVRTIRKTHPLGNIDFILCPTNALFDVREYLVAKEFVLLSESIVAEKSRHYEVLYVSPGDVESTGSQLTHTGAMWDEKNIEHQRYLARIIAHYQRVVEGGNDDRAEGILQRYQSCFSR